LTFHFAIRMSFTQGDSMRAVIQRVSQAQVQVAGETVGAITHGLLVLLGVQQGDTMQDVHYLASKIITLRIFEDDQGKMNRDVREQQGAILAVSQFTLYADCRKGRRPSFAQAAAPPLARQLYEAFLAAVARLGVPVAHGVFGAHMAVSLVNDGPVTILLESPKDGDAA
jgi:D-tyrosyl-tRNA(Tyr) deacylase